MWRPEEHEQRRCPKRAAVGQRRTERRAADPAEPGEPERDGGPRASSQRVHAP